jgi:hypothetical protein
MKIKPLPPLEYLKSLFYLDEEMGELHYMQRRSRVAPGAKVGYVHPSGYVTVELDGAFWRVHRLVFALANDYLPVGEIDHINGIKSDNRPCNLREASRNQNVWNRSSPSTNTSGHKGIFWSAAGKKHWRASICRDGKKHYLGSFESADEAAEAYRMASQELHGEFARS